VAGDANQRDTGEAAGYRHFSSGETTWVRAIYLRNPGCPADALCLLLCAGMRGAEIRKIPYSTRLTPNLWRICLPTFAGKVTFGSVRAMSAIDLSMLWFTGVAIKAWMLPASGPL